MTCWKRKSKQLAIWGKVSTVESHPTKATFLDENTSDK